MTSTADNNNSVAATQPTQVSSTGPKTGSTSPLASLATATDPTNVSSNQQKNSVATFPQRTSNGSPTVCLNGFEGALSSILIFIRYSRLIMELHLICRFHK